jgi:hypothetical protein
MHTLGTVQTIDMNTGEVIAEGPGLRLLPPPPDVCPVCAVAHGRSDPHNQQSMYYRMTFEMEHGRPPTWTDAMAHCAPALQAVWRRHLVRVLKKYNLDIPPDLQ